MRLSKKNISFLPEVQQTAIQSELWQTQLAYCIENVPWWRKRLLENGIKKAQDLPLTHLSKLPVIEKKDLYQINTNHHKNYNSFVDMCSTSGTTGKMLYIPLTHNDIERLAENEAGTFNLIAANHKHVIQLATTLDRTFMAGMAYREGALKIGAKIVRAGIGSVDLHLNYIQALAPGVLITVPSFAVKLGMAMQEKGINQNKIKKILCIGENIRQDDFSLNALGKQLQSLWTAKLYSTYASSEMQTAFTECEYGKGGHHRPELIICEFLDENNQPVPSGKMGELTITHLGVEGFPLIRFKTGDIMRHYAGKCDCGRETLRLGPVLGRKSQLLKIKGTSFFPAAIVDFMQANWQSSFLLRATTNDKDQDHLEVLVDKHNPAFISKFESFCTSHLRIKLPIEVKSKTEIDQMQKVGDRRKITIFADERTIIKS